MMRPFMMPLNTFWVLSAPFEVNATFNNYDFAAGVGHDVTWRKWEEETGDRTTNADWPTRYHAWQATKGHPVIPAGSVIQVTRYHVSNSGNEEITFILIDSPDKRFAPRKRGGTAKGKLRFYLKLADFNNLPELEEYIV